MSSNSPTSNSGSSVSFSIRVNGAPISSTYQVISVNVTSETNKIPVAEIVFADGDVSSNEFPISDSNDFVPGNTISILMGYGGTNTEVFAGAVTGQRIEFDGTGSPKLTVTGNGKIAYPGKPGKVPPAVLTITLGQSVLTIDTKLTREKDANVITGQVSFPGSALATPGAVISLTGVGNRFSGDKRLTAVTQQIADGNWTTSVKFDNKGV